MGDCAKCVPDFLNNRISDTNLPFIKPNFRSKPAHRGGESACRWLVLGRVADESVDARPTKSPKTVNERSNGIPNKSLRLVFELEVHEGLCDDLATDEFSRNFRVAAESELVSWHLRKGAAKPVYHSCLVADNHLKGYAPVDAQIPMFAFVFSVDSVKFHFICSHWNRLPNNLQV